jgi:hypothetical protein
MPEGDGADATTELGNLVRSLAATKEAHHFYPLLFYFRFKDPLYSVSRFSFVLLDATTLIDTALDQRHYGTITASAPVAALRRCGRMLLETLNSNFPTGGDRVDGDSGTKHFHESYLAATRTLAATGIAVRTDGAEPYVTARKEWELLVRRVAPTLGYTMPEIDQRRQAQTASRD